VSASVIGIIAVSAYKLTIQSVSKLDVTSIKSNWLLIVLYLVGVVVTVITQREDILLFTGYGLIYMVVKAPPEWIKRPSMAPSIILLSAGFWSYEGKTLQEIGWFFLKAGAFVFGKR
jgi:chromate transporter